MKISPKIIYQELDKKVVGQKEAKYITSITMYIHAIRWIRKTFCAEKNRKSNLLLMGPSGSGKTYLVRHAVDILREIFGNADYFPLVEIDCTTITSSGWTGHDIGDIIYNQLYEYTPTVANSAIIFLDEIDKICIRAPSSTSGSDFNRQTQYNVLKVVEGTKIYSDHPPGGKVPKDPIDTTEMLFIFAGAFSHLTELLSIEGKPSIGFKNANENDRKNIDIFNELDKGGMATQLVGRISHVSKLTALTHKELFKFATEILIPEVQSLAEFQGYELNFSTREINKVIERALKLKTGARGVIAGIDSLAADCFFNFEYSMEFIK